MLHRIALLALLTLLPLQTTAQIAPGTKIPVEVEVGADGKTTLLPLLAQAPPLPTPPPARYTLTLAQTGTGVCTLTGADSYPAGTQVTPQAIPAADSTFDGWNPVPPITMDADKTATATCTRKPPPSLSTAPNWTRLAVLNPAERAPSWYNLAIDGQGRAYSLNWNSELWRFDPATNTSTKVAQWAPAGNSQHNCSIVYDPISDRVRLSGQCGAGIDHQGYYYDVRTGQSGVYCASCGGGSNAATTYDAAGRRLLAWAGWLSSITYYGTMYTYPLPSGPWGVLRLNPYPTPELPVVTSCDRLSHNRAGYDSRRGRTWIVMAEGSLWTFDGSNLWTLRPTTGDRPNACTVFTYDARLDRIVGWTGRNSATGGAGPVVQKTRLLDLDTLVWSEAVTAAKPPADEVVIMAIGYDAIRGQTLLRTGGAFWALRGAGAPPPSSPAPPPPATPTPQQFTLTLTTAGAGQGTVSGGGRYAAGDPVQLAASAAAGSVFSGWSSAPCAPSFAMPAASLTCTATFTPGGPASPSTGQITPGGPASPSTGQITPRVFTARPVPNALFRSPFYQGNKDVSSLYNPDTQEIVTCTGDYSEPPQSSGHNTCYAYKIATNTWRMVAKPCGPAGSISPARPTDRGQFAYDTRAKRYLFRSLADTAIVGSVCTDVAQPGDPTGSIATAGLLAYSEATKLWTKLFDGKAGVLNEGAFIQGATAADDVLLHLGKGNAVCSFDGFTLVALNLSTGVETTRATSCYTPNPRYSAGNGWLGAVSTDSGRFAWDAAAKRAYICGDYRRLAADVVAERKYVCHVYEDTTRTITKLADLPPLKPGVQPMGIYTVLAWDSLHKVVLFLPPGGNDPCGIIRQVLVYTPATNTWEDIPIQVDASVSPTTGMRGNIIEFDPASNAFFIAGSGFCAPQYPLTVAPLLWRYGP